MSDENRPAYWRRDGERLLPLAPARSPWDERLLHGRLLAALIARALERELLEAGWRCARLSVDLLRPAPLAPVVVELRPLREGGRLRLYEVVAEVEGGTVARATALLLREGEQPPTAAWQAPPWDAPPPLAVEPEASPEARFLPVELRPVVAGGFRAAGRKRIWLREVLTLVEGEEWTPLVRMAAAADLANAVANSGQEPNRFVNGDVTLYLGRAPAGEWVGLEVAGHVSEAGVGTAWCEVHDERGRLGTSTVAALAATRTLAVS